MRSSNDLNNLHIMPFDTFALVLSRLNKIDLIHSNAVCKSWYKVVSSRIPMHGLMAEFQVPEEIILSLQSPDLVYRRLYKIMQQGKLGHTILDKMTCYLYQRYCKSGCIDTNFLHLLDDKQSWFNAYFAGQDTFFLEYHLIDACVSGNFSLVKYLIHEKGCAPQLLHAEYAVMSGQIDLVKYFLENSLWNFTLHAKEPLFKAAIIAGDVNMLTYLQSQYKWHPKENHARYLSCSGNVMMLHYLVETYGKVDVSQLVRNEFNTLWPSKKVEHLKYLLEQLNWMPSSYRYMPEVLIYSQAYNSGSPEAICYVENKFPIHSNGFIESKLLRKSIFIGRLDILMHLLKRGVISQDKMIEYFSGNFQFGLNLSQYYLDLAIRSGNMELVLFFKDVLNIVPTKPDLLQAAIYSQNIDMIRYVMKGNDYPITQDIVNSISHSRNIALISWLFSQSTMLKPDNISDACQVYSLLSTVYHLIENKHCTVDATLLIYAFEAYKKADAHAYLFSHFMQYLINQHHLLPIHEMLVVAKEKNDYSLINTCERALNEFREPMTMTF